MQLHGPEGRDLLEEFEKESCLPEKVRNLFCRERPPQIIQRDDPRPGHYKSKEFIMAFDGAYLCKIKQEIQEMAGGRIDKIGQPARDTLVVTLRAAGGNRRLLISAAAAGAKIHFTTASIENPKAAPMFCMLLRKHLGSGKLLRVEQAGLDRVLSLVFECVNELGDRVELTLLCEIMGRHSNIILLDQNRKIIDAIKRVDFVTSEARQVLPGMTYTPPPQQHKLCPLENSGEELARAVCAGRDVPLSKAILEQVEGFSPMICREIAHFTCPEGEPTAGSLTPAQKERLGFYFEAVRAALQPGSGEPWLVRDPSGKMLDFAFLQPRQFPAEYPLERAESFSGLVDSFYASKDTAERMRQKSADLHKLLTNIRDRLRRKLAAQQEDLRRAEGRERKKELGDIISANLYTLEKGDRVLRAVDFFSETGEMVEIPLDPMLSPSKNAQKYYNEYRKLTTAQAKLQELIQSGTQELQYIETVLSELERVATEAELQGIREEVASQGYTREHREDRGRKTQKPTRLAPLRYLSSDGFTILCGRNNLQNDQLTLREAHNYDLWLHTQKIPGSHTIILSQPGRDFPLRTIEEAAVIAACNSGARESAKVPVDYTQIRNVKKPRGARPGMVIYENYQTAVVNPDQALAQSLLQK